MRVLTREDHRRLFETLRENTESITDEVLRIGGGYEILLENASIWGSTLKLNVPLPVLFAKFMSAATFGYMIRKLSEEEVPE